MLSLFLKKEQQTAFHKIVTSKRRGKIKLFVLLLMQGYSLWCIAFLVFVLQFFQKFCNQYKILYA